MKLQQEFDNNILLLESAENGNNKGRFSVLAFMPDLVLKVEEKSSFINLDFNNPEKFLKEEGDVLQNLRNLIKQSQINNFENINCQQLQLVFWLFWL